MAQARKDGRIGHVPHHRGVDVDIAVDWGYRDATAFVFVQRIGPAYHLIDFFQASGLAVSDYAAMLKDRKREHGYSYGRHYGPHDTLSDNIQMGRSIADTAAESGLYFEVVERGSIVAGINAVRQLLPQYWIDESKCAELVESLERYRYEWNPDLQVFSMKPEHSKWSHACDAVKTFAVGFEEPFDAENYKPAKSIIDFDPFSHGGR